MSRAPNACLVLTTLRRSRRRAVVALVLASCVAACGAPAAYTRKGGAVSELTVHKVSFNAGGAPLGNVRAVAESGEVVCVFADDGATVLVSQAPVATERAVTGWNSAAVLAPPGATPQILGVDGKGRVHVLRGQRSFDDVSDRFALGGTPVHAVTALPSGAVLFAGQEGVVLADGARVTSFLSPRLTELAPHGSGFLGREDGGVYLFDLPSHGGRKYPLPGVTHVASTSKGDVVVTTNNAVYALDSDGALSLLYAADGDTLHGLAASGDTVWFADGEELGVVEQGHVRETAGVHIPRDAELSPSPRGDVWVMGGGALTRYASSASATASGSTSRPAASDLWRDSLSAVFARNCASCHLPSGSAGVNLSTVDRWQAKGADIRERVVVKRDMPPQGHALSDADREAIRSYLEPAK